ncbi:AAEL017573-PA [Aedes aegypti]|uniref:AAEL017573-PA n=1 Tax=Aedes aegypti TaxID=7159 RepID=J9HFB9_AEDAE|nr:AAEL017573-PA [Aedes aegypti]
MRITLFDVACSMYILFFFVEKSCFLWYSFVKRQSAHSGPDHFNVTTAALLFSLAD